MTAIPQGRDWTRMRRADFDASAPLDLIDEGVCRPVPAAPDEYGVEALFGRDPQPARPCRARTSPPVTTDTLF
ncbi:hypothetical protein ACIQVT_00690 [Streptomyces sp. NPDC100445]|uniref:hypothetical protein n=1 Tax=Streptomyces sp. NPDC100445 TaxID=3366102 RepID=UPI00381A7B61